MATNFPNSLDNLTNPSTSSQLNNPSHAAQHTNANDAIEALEQKVGADNSSNPNSLDYKVRSLENNYLNVDAVEDLAAGLITSGSHTNITVAYDDNARKINLTATYDNTEAINAIGTALTAGTGLTKTYSQNPPNYRGDYDNGYSYALNDVVSIPAGSPYGVVGSYFIRSGNPSNPGYPPEPGGATNASWSLYTYSPTITLAIDTNTVASQAYVNQAISNLVDASPALLDTLNEIAAAINDDSNFATTITTALGNKLDSSTAASTYLTQSNAASTYLTQANAASTYATQQYVLNNKGIPSGNPTQRPPNFLSSNGDTFVNTTSGYLEIYSSTYGWESVGKIPSISNISATNNSMARAYNNGSIEVDLGLPSGRSYTITTTPTTTTTTSNTPYAILTGLQSNTSYTVTATATNLYGTSPAVTSSPVTVTTVPQAPVIQGTIVGNSSVTLLYTVNNGGSQITSHTIYVRVNNTVVNEILVPTNTIQGSYEVTGLTNGTGYTFIMTSTNANGTSLNSLSTNAVYPVNNTTPSVDYLVVAGGGGGGGDFGGGGGAGGYRTGSSFAVTANTLYNITVGAGGTGATAASAGSQNTNGVDSTFSTVTSVGGGKGGSEYNGYSPSIGGSGGGGAINMSGAAGTSGQGNAGGSGAIASTNIYYTGGGGGAGGAGSAGSSANGGAGGVGLASSITGTLTYYAGGGGGMGGNEQGGTATAGAGGNGGGGNGGANNINSSPNLLPQNGTANTGGGGGGASNRSVAHPGGSGGSGIVVIRYPDTYAAASTTGSPTITVSGGYRIYKFTANGSITF